MTHLNRWAVALCLTLIPAVGLAQDRFFDSNGVRIRYVDRGTGELVVLIHGNGGSLQGWIDSGILADLAQDHRVVALDARGHGKSGKPHETQAYGREMGLDVIRLMDHLGVGRAHVVGYSMGASITAHVLTTHPQRFLTATLGGAPGRFQWTAEDTARAEVEAAEKERECVSRTQMQRLAPTPVHEDVIRKRSAECMADPNQDRFALAALHRSFKDMAISPVQVASVKVPTLGIVGSLDPYLPAFRALKKLLPSLDLVVIDGATHGGEQGAMRRPEFLAAVRRFIGAPRTSAR
jgi:pimeloyl-ACP methyl ester carboxylesterase